MLRWTKSSLTSSVRVSAKKTTKGSFTYIISTSSLPIHRFPSPRQFHARQLIVLGGANDQPPPIQKLLHHHPEKPVVTWTVIWLDQELQLKPVSTLGQI